MDSVYLRKDEAHLRPCGKVKTRSLARVLLGICRQSNHENPDPEIMITPENPAGENRPAPELITLKENEKRHIALILRCCPSLGCAAMILDIDPATLLRKRGEYGLGFNKPPPKSKRPPQQN